jgi:predicted TIM-barrel fold metal-dependent hydrolase
MRAIDMHCHIPTEEGMRPFAHFQAATSGYYKMSEREKPVSEAEFARMLTDLRVKAVLVSVDAESATGQRGTSNDHIAHLVETYPEAFLAGYACVDPWKGKAAVAEVERAIRVLGLRGVKFHPIVQAFAPNDRRFYPIYELCSSLRVPVQFHTGMTGVGVGMKGSGIHLKYGHPLALDDVAADFPDLTIIACHASWPWQDEMLMVLLHKSNVFNELSGWSPKYFTEALKREIAGRLQDKFLFGSDYPALTHERLFADWEAGGYTTQVLEKVFYKNAERLLDL